MSHAPVVRQIDRGGSVDANAEYVFVATDSEGVRWSVNSADLHTSTHLNAVDDVNTRRILRLRGEIRARASLPAGVMERTIAINCARREFSVVPEARGPADANVRRAVSHLDTGNSGDAGSDTVAAKVMSMVCP